MTLATVYTEGVTGKRTRWLPATTAVENMLRGSVYIHMRSKRSRVYDALYDRCSAISSGEYPFSFRRDYTADNTNQGGFIPLNLQNIYVRRVVSTIRRGYESISCPLSVFRTRYRAPLKVPSLATTITGDPSK